MINQAQIDNFIKQCILNGFDKFYTLELLNKFVKSNQSQRSFNEFIEIQKIIEPRWSYQEKFFQRVINDYDWFLDSKQYDIDLFLLEAPPRTGKTELITGFGVPYLLSRQPNLRIIIVSGNQALKRKLRKTITRIIKSDIYKQKYNIFLTIDNATEIQTSNGGLVLFTTTLSEVPTGEGFHFIFMEDALTHTMIKSPAKTENAFEQIDGILTRTQDDPRTKVIVNNQRLGFNDLSARLLERYKEVNREILQITMPYYFENEISIFDKKGNEYFFNENEFLINRFDNIKKDFIIAKIGKDEFTTQYQQNPVNSADVIVKKEWWNYYSCDWQSLDLIHLFITTDLAFSLKTNADYTVICCWGMGRDKKLYLIDMIRQKVEYTEAKQIFKNFYEKYRYVKVMNKSFIYCKAFYIEDTTPSKPLISDLKKDISSMSLIERNKDKYSRLSVCLNEIENGFVVLPNYKEFTKILIQEAYEFRKDDTHNHDDIVDCFIDAITQELKTNSNVLKGYNQLANAIRQQNI